MDGTPKQCNSRLLGRQSSVIRYRERNGTDAGRCKRWYDGIYRLIEGDAESGYLRKQNDNNIKGNF
ncbi:hypothetical protein J8TS2_24210 [Lederbergia ruris]|uniref:Uncharacterized protein n=1 Tax=Lederbergia ruris TaxID=217495 RepID=A0ABQ4KJM5_9BACI|nr:hypothetical protein J8TS2_24210 [Lederbergia ruris]